MTVFKGYMKVIRQSRWLILMYVAIFFACTLLMQSAAGKAENSSQAEALKTKKNPGKQQQKVLDFVIKNGKITRKQVEELIGSGSTKAFKLIKELCEKGQMKAQGAGKHSYYVLV